MTLNNEDTRTIVRSHYGHVAQSSPQETQGGGCSPGCCGAKPDASLALGYDEEQLAAVPDGANMGLGCGNPQAIAALKPGETVLDLGSGGGFDCFLAARQVGPKGTVIGVDMTPEMVAKARSNASSIDASNVDFRLGEIEHLPVVSDSIDVIISNCVINLSPEKAKVFAEAARVLRPGGRIAISDVVATAEIPAQVQNDALATAGCVAGAARLEEIETWLAAAGFTDIAVKVRPGSASFIEGCFPGMGAEDYVASATIEGTKAKPGVGSKDCCAPTCCADEPSKS